MMRTEWQSAEAMELARAADIEDPVAAMRHHVAAELQAAGPLSFPLSFASLFSSLGVRKVREKQMVIEGGLRPVDDTTFDILVRHDRPRRRQRFTIAHELGHLLFYKHAPEAKRLQKRDGRRAPLEEERLCNIAAEEFLMPTWLVEEVLGRSADPTEAVIELSKACDVSVQAALVRVSRAWDEAGVMQLWCRSNGSWSQRLSARAGSHQVSIAFGRRKRAAPKADTGTLGPPRREKELARLQVQHPELAAIIEQGAQHSAASGRRAAAELPTTEVYLPEHWHLPQSPSGYPDARLIADRAAALAEVAQSGIIIPPPQRATLDPESLWQMASTPFRRSCWLRPLTGAKHERGGGDFRISAVVNGRRVGTNMLLLFYRLERAQPEAQAPLFARRRSRPRAA